MAKKAEKHDAENFRCRSCGGQPRKHDVLFRRQEPWFDYEIGASGYTVHIVAQCRGCESLRFVLKESDSTMPLDDYGSEHVEVVKIFPDDASDKKRTPVLDDFDLPLQVARMYHETLSAFDVGAFTLAGAGLRAIVEALCLDQQVSGKDLKRKIDELVTAGLLALKQAEHLHEERYLGNDAIHQMSIPSRKDLEDGLRIVENLLQTIYVLPQHAAGLRRSREARAAKKATSGGATSAASKTSATTSKKSGS